MFKLSELRIEAIDFLKSMRIGDSWDFKFSPSTGPTLIGSSLAAMLAGLVGWTDELSENDKRAWADRIKQCQRDDGWFDDDDISEQNLRPGYEKSRALLHRIRHAIMALEVLGYQPEKQFDFIEQWLEEGCIRSWCQELDLSNYWYSSNMMMDASVLLLESFTRWGVTGAKNAVMELLDFCDESIDPKTGFHDRGQSELRNAMAGAMHLFPVYVMMDRKILYADQAIEATLSLQQPDGLFGYETGSGSEDCLDYDAAVILSNLGFQKPKLRHKILEAFDCLEAGLSVCRNADGGFRPHCRDEIYFFGTNTTPVKPGESSLWATYSRLMAYLIIDGFRNQKQPEGWHTAHNIMEIWDGGKGLMEFRPFKWSSAK